MRWSEQDTFEFVKLYLKYENLWNPDNEEYKIKERRENSYREIMRMFKEIRGITLFEKEIKSKIKSLRSTYSQELSKIKKRSGPDYVYIPSIKWFPDMHMQLKNLSRIKLDAFQDNQNIEENEQILVIDEYKAENDEMESYQPEGIVIVEKQNVTQQQPESSSKVRRKIKHNRTSNDCDSTYRYSTKDNCSTKEDEFDIYGKYIASQLRCMDIRKALKLQIEIQTLVNETRINEIDEDNKFEYI